MRDDGKFEIVNPDGEVVGRCYTYRNAEKICKLLSNEFGGEYDFHFAA